MLVSFRMDRSGSPTVDSASSISRQGRNQSITRTILSSSFSMARSTTTSHSVSRCRPQATSSQPRQIPRYSSISTKTMGHHSSASLRGCSPSHCGMLSKNSFFSPVILWESNLSSLQRRRTKSGSLRSYRRCSVPASTTVGLTGRRLPSTSRSVISRHRRQHFKTLQSLDRASTQSSPRTGYPVWIPCLQPDVHRIAGHRRLNRFEHGRQHRHPAARSRT